MRQFPAIEGLRAWLAWTVVCTHLIQTSGLFLAPGFHRLWQGGHVAVMLFIIISGFVITHLILEKPQPYLSYIGQRFMRLYPAYVVSCVLAVLTLPLYVKAMERVSWPVDSWLLELMQNLVRTNSDLLWAHIAAHATMLHGAISNTILPYSGYALSGVTWSISLEWQFYLVAPFVAMLALDRRTAPFLALAVLVGHLLFQRGYLGQYMNWSILPATGAYFMIGIASRLVLPHIEGKHSAPVAMVACLVALVPISSEHINILLIWCGFMILLTTDRRHLQKQDSLIIGIYRACFESRVARWLGARSYSIYLFHFSIISIVHYWMTGLIPSATRGETLLILTFCVVPLTVIVSALSYRMIEKPGIKLGRKLFGAGQKPAIAAAG